MEVQWVFSGGHRNGGAEKPRREWKIFPGCPELLGLLLQRDEQETQHFGGLQDKPMFEGPVENDEEDIIFFRSGVGRVMT